MNQIIHGDAFVEIIEIPDNSIDLCLTDPPYGLDKMSNDWSVEVVNSEKNMEVVTSLPSGMRFDRNQGYELQKWMTKISIEILRVLKPGGFFFCWSSPRLYHRVACAIEDAGFLIKDQYAWLYVQNQPKAMSLNHVIEKQKISPEEKDVLKNLLDGWKTPQVKSNHEPIAVAQKPVEENFLTNYDAHRVGLINTKEKLGTERTSFPSNVIVDNTVIDNNLQKHFLVPKPTRMEKGDFNTHKTVKPLSLCEYLIRLTTRPGQVVLDPFAGSGTTLVAAKHSSRDYIGIELNQEYVEIIEKRLCLLRDNSC